jgi:hypothetical protein
LCRLILFNIYIYYIIIIYIIYIIIKYVYISFISYIYMIDLDILRINTKTQPQKCHATLESWKYVLKYVQYIWHQTTILETHFSASFFWGLLSNYIYICTYKNINSYYVYHEYQLPFIIYIIIIANIMSTIWYWLLCFITICVANIKTKLF